MRNGARTILALSLALGLALAGGLASCDGGRDRLAAVATLAASTKGGRAAAAAELGKLLGAGKVTHDQAITEAVRRLEELPEVLTATAPSLDATAFAGAVLDAIAARQGNMLTGGEYELFWRRVGGLALRAAEEANARSRVAEARTLVFAGGDRWQNEAYWMARPDHDALAAMIMATLGERAEAIARLRSRPDLQGPAQLVYQHLIEQR